MDNLKTKGKLGILIPGMGAVASTLIAGVEAIKSCLLYTSPSPRD